jgi:hypothetical protein
VLLTFALLCSFIRMLNTEHRCFYSIVILLLLSLHDVGRQQGFFADAKLAFVPWIGLPNHRLSRQFFAMS